MKSLLTTVLLLICINCNAQTTPFVNAVKIASYVPKGGKFIPTISGSPAMIINDDTLDSLKPHVYSNKLSEFDYLNGRLTSANNSYYIPICDTSLTRERILQLMHTKNEEPDTMFRWGWHRLEERYFTVFAKKKAYYSITNVIVGYWMPNGEKLTYEQLLATYTSLQDNRVFKANFK